MAVVETPPPLFLQRNLGVKHEIYESDVNDSGNGSDAARLLDDQHHSSEQHTDADQHRPEDVLPSGYGSDGCVGGEHDFGVADSASVVHATEHNIDASVHQRCDADGHKSVDASQATSGCGSVRLDSGRDAPSCVGEDGCESAGWSVRRSNDSSFDANTHVSASDGASPSANYQNQLKGTNMNVAQIAGVAASTVEQVAPVVLETLAATNPKIAAALPAIEALLAAFQPLLQQGIVAQTHVDAAVKVAAVAAVTGQQPQ